MEDYIFLDRRFVEFDPKVEGERDNYSFAIASLFSGAKSWQQILEQPCTVIVAEAGNGKTAELRYQTIALREDGKAAFFGNLGLLANAPLGQALEISTAGELSAWQKGTAHGYF